MAKITFKGDVIHTLSSLPSVGSHAPDFTATKTDLSEISLKSFKDKKIILNIFPSLDTPTCAMSVRKFNEKAAQLSNVVVLCISADLPFAQNRFCGAEGLTNVIPLSIFRHPEFGKKYGVTIIEGPLAGLLSRAVLIMDEKHQVIYGQQVPEIAQEPDYEAALKVFS